jgi:hypothetical protein
MGSDKSFFLQSATVTELNTLLAGKVEGEEMSFFASNLLTKINPKSSSLNILKFIQQGIILFGTQIMKTTLTRDIMTRDIRSRQGWLIYIDLKEDCVKIVHARREQTSNLKAEGSNFELEWYVS